MTQKPLTSGSTRVLMNICNALYVSVSLSLIGIALTLMGYAVWHAVVAIRTNGNVVAALLSAIGLIVISMAVLDIGKFLIQEEVLRDRELRSAVEARQTPTKFMVIITAVQDSRNRSRGTLI
jgi:heme exporter protein D